MGTSTSPYSAGQMAVWVHGLLAVAWADGHYSAEEKDLLERLARGEWGALPPGEFAVPPTDGELAAALAGTPDGAENFLRTAVMVALADGVYSEAEDALLKRYCAALGHSCDVLAPLRHTPSARAVLPAERVAPPGFDPLHPVRDWLDRLQVRDARLARFLCRLIPAQCPFERDVVLFGRKVVHIPAMCELNPLYGQLVGLRFRALSYLADECREDVRPYL